MKPDIDEIRQAIDEIDDRLLELVNQRMELAVAIGKTRGHPSRDKTREASIINRLKTLAVQTEAVDDQAVIAIWQTILDQSRRAQARSVDTIKL